MHFRITLEFFEKDKCPSIFFFLQSFRCDSNEQPCLETTGLYDDLLLWKARCFWTELGIYNAFFKHLLEQLVPLGSQIFLIKGFCLSSVILHSRKCFLPVLLSRRQCNTHFSCCLASSSAESSSKGTDHIFSSLNISSVSQT